MIPQGRQLAEKLREMATWFDTDNSIGPFKEPQEDLDWYRERATTLREAADSLEQLRDAVPMAQQTSRSELMRHAVQRGGRPMDVAALPAPVGGQTPPSSPVLAFQEWATRRAEQFGPLSQDQYLLAQEAFFAAHPGEGPSSQFIEKVGGQTPTEPPHAEIEIDRLRRASQPPIDLDQLDKWRIELTSGPRLLPDWPPVERILFSDAIFFAVTELRKLRTAPPPPGAPPAFTREQLEADAAWCENRAGTYAPRRAIDGRNNEAIVALERRDVYGRLADICRFVAQTLPAEGRQETR